MKYWNKDKRIRQEHWHWVKRPRNRSYPDIKRQLQLNDSPGRFYLYFAGDRIWFEHEQDAVWFLLGK